MSGGLTRASQEGRKHVALSSFHISSCHASVSPPGDHQKRGREDEKYPQQQEKTLFRDLTGSKLDHYCMYVQQRAILGSHFSEQLAQRLHTRPNLHFMQDKNNISSLFTTCRRLCHLHTIARHAKHYCQTTEPEPKGDLERLLLLCPLQPTSGHLCLQLTRKVFFLSLPRC